MGLIRRVWRGEAGLARTFWVFGLAVSVLFKGVFLLVTATAGKSPAFVTILLALFILSLGYQAFISVAIWRSATRYQGKREWAYLAKAMVVLCIIQTVLALTGIA